MIEIRPIITEEKGKGKAFLLTGAFNPYTIGHEEMARGAARHARDTGHSHIYHGIGASEKSEDAPLSMHHKRKVIRASHKHLSKDVKGIRFGILPKEHSTPFHQVLHLAKQGHSHVTIGLGSDQMGEKGLKGALERHVRQHGGMLDHDGKTVHPVKLGFHRMGEKRDERPLHRNELLRRLKSGDLTVAKAGHLRKAVREGDTELAHALMPASVNRAKYRSMIAKAQSTIPAKKPRKKVVKEDIHYLHPEVRGGKRDRRDSLAPMPVYDDEYRAVLDKASFGSNTSHENLGEFHPGYELHRHKITKHDGTTSHDFHMVHKASGRAVGRIETEAGKYNRKEHYHDYHKPGNDLSVQDLRIHPSHGRKVIGASLAKEAYRHLHRLGHRIVSGSSQTPGGARVWEDMRRDPELKKHITYKGKNAEPLRVYGKRQRGLHSTQIWTNLPSEPGEYGEEAPLVLNPKPKKREKVVKEGFLSFAAFVAEAPELDPYIEPAESEHPHKYDKHFTDRKKQHVYDPKNDKYIGHRNHGEIHPGYELHRHTVARRATGRGEDPVVHVHRYTIVHKKTKDVAGEIDATAGKMDRKTGEHRPGTGKGLRIDWLGVHPDHSSRKVGKSLAVAAYKHLHGKGHSIKSDRRQSFGGAHVWDTLRKDPDVKDHVKYHDEKDNKAVPAHKLDYGNIWQEHPSGQETTLVLHAKPRKKVVKEDIELDPYMVRSHFPLKKEKFDSAFMKDKERTTGVIGGKGKVDHTKFVGHKNLGEFHPGYELHRHTKSMVKDDFEGRKRRFHYHEFSIVHKQSGEKVGEIDAKAGRIDSDGEHHLGRGKGLKVQFVGVHPDHSSKKVGASLPLAAYKHLHRLGHSIKSDTVQSEGGKRLWDSLRNDPETKHHVLMHDERDFMAIPASLVPSHVIWEPHGRGQKRTLVLHAKPKKKAVSEDIELIPVQRDRHAEKPRKAADVHKGYATKDYSHEKIVTKKNLGEIHPGYDLHHHSRISRDHRGRDVLRHQFTIVHRASGDVAGEMNAKGGKLHPTKGVVPGPKGKGLKVTHLEVHPDHSSKKVGTSLAVEMYRHLHRRGHAIQSDAIQSHGAAHVWNTMRNDRELKKHMMIHSNREPLRGELHTFEKRAHRRPERHIWYQHSRDWSVGRGKVEGSHGDEPDEVRTLVLSGKKRRKKMTEDIEMSNVMDKPFGGYHRDFSRVIHNPWASKQMTMKRSGRIAKGYTLHTGQDLDDSKVQRHYIVHDATNHVAGEIHTRSHDGDHEVISTEIHGDHTRKKIGKSLAVLAYKHLARKKGSLTSSALQSPGGASIWNRLRKDPKMKGQIFHKRRGHAEVPAHDVPDKLIWASEVKIKGKPKSAPEHLPWSKHHSDEHSNVMGSRLVIRPVRTKS